MTRVELNYCQIEVSCMCIYIVNRLRMFLLYSYILDIGPSQPYVVPTTPSVKTQDDKSQVVVDVYLAEYMERSPGLYLQPGWIASISLSLTETITYGDVKNLIYNSTEEIQVSLFDNVTVFHRFCFFR